MNFVSRAIKDHPAWIVLARLAAKHRRPPAQPNMENMKIEFAFRKTNALPQGNESDNWHLSRSLLLCTGLAENAEKSVSKRKVKKIYSSSCLQIRRMIPIIERIICLLSTLRVLHLCCPNFLYVPCYVLLHNLIGILIRSL